MDLFQKLAPAADRGYVVLLLIR